MKRPRVIFSAAMTIDGKIASKTGDAELSDEVDWREVHAIRKDCDAVVVGIGTILKDNPKLRVKFFENLERYPARLVVDSNLRIPLEAQVFQFEPKKYKTYVATTQRTLPKKISALREMGVEVLICGEGPMVDLNLLLKQLEIRGMQKIMLEGGGRLAWGFVEADLVDEIRLFVAPFLCGGQEATSLVMGEGFAKIQASRKFRLEAVNKRDDYVILNYRRER